MEAAEAVHEVAVGLQLLERIDDGVVFRVSFEGKVEDVFPRAVGMRTALDAGEVQVALRETAQCGMQCAGSAGIAQHKKQCRLDFAGFGERIRYLLMKASFSLSEDYRKFISDCKTERECVAESVKLAKAAGFKDLAGLIKAGKKVKAGDKVYAVNQDKNIILFVVGKKPVSEGMVMLGAHIDSPRIDIKQNPLWEDVLYKTNYAMMDTHYYGGIKKYQWVTLPLAIHGVVCKKDGSVLNINIYIQIFCELANRIKREANKRVLIEIALIRLCTPQMDSDISALNQRMFDIEEKIETGNITVSAGAGADDAAPRQRPVEKKLSLPPAMSEDIKKAVGEWREIQKSFTGMIGVALKGSKVKTTADDTFVIVCTNPIGQTLVDDESLSGQVRNTICNALQKDIKIRICTEETQPDAVRDQMDSVSFLENGINGMPVEISDV